MGIFSRKIFKKNEDKAEEKVEEKVEEKPETQVVPIAEESAGEENIPKMPTVQAEKKDLEKKPTVSSEPKYSSQKITRGANGKFLSKKTPEKKAAETKQSEEEKREETVKEVQPEEAPDDVSEQNPTELEVTPDVSEQTPTEPTDPEETPDLSQPTPSDEETNQIKPNYQALTFYSKEIRKIYKDKTWYFSLDDILQVFAVDDPTTFLEKLKENQSTKKAFDEAVTQINFSDQDGSNMVDCITYEGFMTLLPIVRDEGYMLPGPFPDWLKNLSEQEEVQEEG